MNNIVFKRESSIVNSKDFHEAMVSEISISNLFSNIDVKMHEFIEEKLSGQKYVNIFIPLSFGASYSDFLGLRLAFHIRTTPLMNQCSNIFIYGTEDITNISKYNELYTILFSKGVKLIEYNLEIFKKYISINEIILSKKELITELSKLNLKCPDNFYDNHSISNIWGMFRILELEGIDFKEIKSLNDQKEKLMSIYFKWILAKNKNNGIVDAEIEEVKKKYNHITLPGPKILGKIDLPIDKKKRI